MLSKPLTDKQIEEAFEKFIQDPSGGIPSEYFDSRTEAALMQVMMDSSPLAIANARKELYKQLDGTHAKEDRAEIEKLLNAPRNKRK